VVPDAVSRYAPLVYLDRTESYWPAPVPDILGHASLWWSPGGHRPSQRLAGGDPAVGAIDAARLGAAAAQQAYKAQGASAYEDARPWSRRPGEAAASDRGFYIAFDRPDRTGVPPAAADVYAQAPVYFEYEPKRFVTYWFFYGGSTIPLGLIDLTDLEQLAGPETAPAELADPELQAELSAYVSRLPEPDTGEELAILDVFDEARRKLEFLRRLVGDQWPMCHEGDWESICVALDDGEQMGKVAYFQHGGDPQIVDAKLEQGSHPVVYSAKGSHASYPAPRHGIDVADDPGRQWETWHALEDARAEPWYGFGGAWGKLGAIEDATGPRGPSPYKPPAPKGW
jgi:hypothetical protein